MSKKPAPRNRTLTLSRDEVAMYRAKLLQLRSPASLEAIIDRTINQDLMSVIPLLPERSVDLLILDPPYNLTKSFNGRTFRKRSLDAYEDWIESWLPPLMRVLKPTASVYFCSDWQSSAAVHRVAEKYLEIRNRITWEREKGRGAQSNWKNCSEDIWYCTVSDNYVFHVDAVKLKRRVLAPYRDDSGRPKDWQESDNGAGYRLTHPSNLWTDITVPFWSMPENTEHPTQKPEKLMAKLILASTNEGDVVLDPFLGSGTTSVVARKLGRRFVGIEIDTMYCCLAEKRLDRAAEDASIQGYDGSAFWERNSLQAQKKEQQTRPPASTPGSTSGQQSLFATRRKAS